jgi:hypothetical protein
VAATGGKKPASLADIVASATRAERTVTICTAGHLNAEYDRLQQQLQDATRDTGSLADDGQRSIAEQMEQVRQQMREHEHTFTFRALTAAGWSDLLVDHPPREDRREIFNTATFPLPCVAASLVRINDEDVTVTVDELKPLWNDALNDGQRDELFGAAWEANKGRVSVPFSPLASATLDRTGEK